jgi:hypothetical protein
MRGCKRRAFLVSICIGLLAASWARAEEPAGSVVEDSVISPSESTFWVDSPIGPLTYRSARGFSIGDTGLNIGGFTTAEFDRNEGEALNVSLDNFNFLVLYEPIDRFRIFSEIEIGNLFSYEVHGDTDSAPSFTTERLYGELSLADAFNVRFGKFQTPVGRWNLVPAEPFIWTASNPVLVDTAFDEHTTGVALFGTFFEPRGTVEYWVYSQVIDPLNPGDTPPPANRNVGSRLAFTESGRRWSIGTSFLASRRKGNWSYLGGLDGELELGRFGLQSEFIYEKGGIPGRDRADFFVQSRVELVRNFFFVARYEYVDVLGSNGDDTNLGDVGFAWPPYPWLIMKATYRFSDNQNEDVRRGLTSSISVVF